jgi:hypothetical protein
MTPPEAAPALALPAPGVAPAEGRWIRDLVFDWTFFLGSTFLVFLVAGLFSVKPGGTNLLELTGAAAALNLVIPVLLGGPHIFFSVVRTYMDVDFKREHRTLLRMTPHLVAFSMIYLVFHGFHQVVVNVVLYSAVFHGAAQLAHIGLRYRMKAGRRTLDAAGVAYLVACLAGPLYFVSGAVREREMVFVGYEIWRGLAPDAVYWGAGIVAALAAAYWLADLVNHRLAGGRVNWRETAILAATTGAFWFLANLRDLDTTFQAYNAWHSIQALGIMWFAMNAKWRGGKIRGPKQSAFCRDGAFKKTYLWGVVFSVGIGLLVILFSNFQVANLTGSPFYFIFAVTVLLNHHVLDYWLFFGKRAFDY